MNYKSIMTQEERLRAEDVIRKMYRGNVVACFVRKLFCLLLLILCFRLIGASRYTHSAFYFMLGWTLMPLPVIGWIYVSWEKKPLKSLLKLKKKGKNTVDTLMDETVVDDEKITINEIRTIFYKDVKAAIFARGFAVVTDGKSQPVFVKLSDEGLVELHAVLSDKKLFRKKKMLFVTLEPPKMEYYLPEIEEKRKYRLKKRQNKLRIVSLAIAMISLALSVVYVMGHLMEDDINPDVEYTYTEGENLHDMLDRVVGIGNSPEPVFDVYLDYADKTFGGYVKFTGGKKGERQITVCFPVGEDNVYIRNITDRYSKKERTVVHGQFSGRDRYIRELFEADYVSEKYPLIADYIFFIDNWKLTLKDGNFVSLKGEGIYKFMEDSVSFEEKGDEQFTIHLEKAGTMAMLRTEKLFEELEAECGKPYDEQNIQWNELKTDILYNIRVED